MYLYEYVNRCIAIHTYDYDKSEEDPVRVTLLRALFVCVCAKSKKIIRESRVSCQSVLSELPSFALIKTKWSAYETRRH